MPVLEQTKYLEMVDSISPTTHQWAIDGASAQMTFIIDKSDFYAFVTDILGAVGIDPITKKLIRKTPLSFPEYPWLFAERITAFVGLGIDGRVLESSFQPFDAYYALDRKTVKFASVYQKYKITVEFTTRPYIIFSDADRDSWGVVPRNNWFISNNVNGVVTSFNVPYDDNFEYLRYTSITVKPAPQLLTNNLGKWSYKTTGLVDTSGPQNNDTVTTQSGSGSNKVIQKNEVRLKWFYVPYAFVNNINFIDAYGKINFDDFYGFKAGTLLFKNIEIDEYAPPYPYENIDVGTSVTTISTSAFKNKYCDITFIFEEFVLSADERGTLPTDYQVVLGKIFNHHNCMPYTGNNLFYYVENKPSDQKATGLPIFWSYGMANLFNYNPYIDPS